MWDEFYFFQSAGSSTFSYKLPAENNCRHVSVLKFLERFFLCVRADLNVDIMAKLQAASVPIA